MIYASSNVWRPGESSSSAEQSLPKAILPQWTPTITKKDVLNNLKTQFGFESVLAYEAGGGYAPNSFNGGIWKDGNSDESQFPNSPITTGTYTRPTRPTKPTQPIIPGGGGSSGGGGGTIEPDEPSTPNGGDNPNNPNKKNKTKSTALLLLLGTILLNS